MPFFLDILSRAFGKSAGTATENALHAQSAGWTKPTHLGFILDGNRRFARATGLNRIIDGHALGAEKLREVLRWCMAYDIKIVTAWIFSLENFDRDDEEVRDLLDLMETKFRDLLTDTDVHGNHIRVNFIGRTHLLPESLQATMAEVEAATADYQAYTLNVAIAYSGREEATDAFKAHLQNLQTAGKTLEEAIESLTPTSVDAHLYTAGQPPPDLIIRTSGELRMSGFLLWQSAYAEFYFCKTFWPAFRRLDLLQALESYHQRQRRYGK
jgi:short-chain Z-isoprenyl diphosphate synthase